MKTLRQQLEDQIEARNVMNFDPQELIRFSTIENYNHPHKYSCITLEEFCELNGLTEEELTDDQINIFYKNYGRHPILPMSEYDLNHDHNDWIIENLQSHNYEIVVKRLKKLLEDDLIHYNTDASEKHQKSRIISLCINKDTNIANIYSEHTFKLNKNELSDKIYDILNFHNYYVTTIKVTDKYCYLTVEPKQTSNATSFVKSSQYAYHITYKHIVNEILKKGLRPKAKKTQEKYRYRYFTDRVFLISDSDDLKNDISQVITDLNAWDDYVILKIDISKLNITFWWDDASKGHTVYTVDSIPPKLIQVIDNIEKL